MRILETNVRLYHVRDNLDLFIGGAAELYHVRAEFGVFHSIKAGAVFICYVLTCNDSYYRATKRRC